MVLVIAGLKKKLLEPEVAAIEQFLRQGGRVLCMVDPFTETGLELLLSAWKIKVGSDIIVDSNAVGRLLGLGPAAPMIYANDNAHPITQDLTSPGVMPTVRSLTVATGGEPAVETRAFLFTGEAAWGETNPVDGTAEQDNQDNAGPLPVAIVATKKIPAHEASKLSEEARLAVFGDSDWVNNQYLDKVGNLDLLVNTIDFLASEEGRITINRKTRTASHVYFSMKELAILKFVTLDLLWVTYVAIGLAVGLVRRQR